MAAKFQVLSFDPAESSSKIREHKKRKFHAKTRSGCVSCKQKRVKCDEVRPACNRCVRNDRPCLYDSTPLTTGSRAQGGPKSSSSSGSLSMVKSVSTSPSFGIELALPVDCATKYGGTSAGVLLQFFNQNHESMLSGSPLPIVWDLSCQYPHLLTAILSASACYLRHHTADPSPHAIAETYQQSLTLRTFQTSLEQPLNKGRADALLMTAVYMNLLAFTSVEDEEPLNSWVFSTDPRRLGWVNILLGIGPLFMATQAFREGSVLTPMYEASDDGKKTFTGSSWDFPLPPSWEKFLQLNYKDADIFGEAAYVLFATCFIPPTQENIFMYMQFFGRVGPKFRDLLLLDDERALWMFGYWLGLLGRVEAWFTKRRIRRDYTAIVINLRGRNLEARPRDEGGMWRQLLDELEGLRNDWHTSNR